MGRLFREILRHLDELVFWNTPLRINIDSLYGRHLADSLPHKMVDGEIIDLQEVVGRIVRRQLIRRQC